MSYESTAEEIAKLRGVSTQTVKNWALLGYPLDDGSRIPLPGADKSGRKWVFDKKVIEKFFDNIRHKRWQMFTNPNTKTQKLVKVRNLNIGLIDSKLAAGSIAEQLAKRLNLQH